SHGGVVMGILPIATALVAVAITHERPKPLFWIASAAGASLVIAFALRQGGGTLSAGDLLLFAAVGVSAIGYAFSGRLTAGMPAWPWAASHGCSRCSCCNLSSPSRWRRSSTTRRLHRKSCCSPRPSSPPSRSAPARGFGKRRRFGVDLEPRLTNNLRRRVPK